MATKTSTSHQKSYWNTYWWSLLTLFLGVILGAFLFRTKMSGVSVVPMSGGKETMIISAGSGIVSGYPNVEGAYQVTLKNVSPRILWLSDKQISVSLDKFLNRVWYEDDGERMRNDPLMGSIVMTKPTDGKLLVMGLKMTDPRYDSRAKTLIFRADSVGDGMFANKLSDMPSSFLVNDFVFEANRFSGFEYLKSLK